MFLIAADGCFRRLPCDDFIPTLVAQFTAAAAAAALTPTIYDVTAVACVFTICVDRKGAAFRPAFAGAHAEGQMVPRERRGKAQRNARQKRCGWRRRASRDGERESLGDFGGVPWLRCYYRPRVGYACAFWCTKQMYCCTIICVRSIAGTTAVAVVVATARVIVASSVFTPNRIILNACIRVLALAFSFVRPLAPLGRYFRLDPSLFHVSTRFRDKTRGSLYRAGSLYKGCPIYW